MRGRDLQIALEFAFLDDPLMRLVGALDAILTIIAFGRKQLCDLVDAACRATAIGPRSVEHALADLELVLKNSITEIDRKGIVLTPSEVMIAAGTKRTSLDGSHISNLKGKQPGLHQL